LDAPPKHSLAIQAFSGATVMPATKPVSAFIKLETERRLGEALWKDLSWQDSEIQIDFQILGFSSRLGPDFKLVRRSRAGGREPSRRQRRRKKSGREIKSAAQQTLKDSLSAPFTSATRRLLPISTCERLPGNSAGALGSGYRSGSRANFKESPIPSAACAQ
jgi:hypothetical protein